MIDNIDTDLHKTLLDWAVLFARRSIHDFLRFARENHLSMPQINVLLRLYYSGPSTILQLRGENTASRAAASQMIDELVRGGWIERSESAADRRVKSVELTLSGRELVERGIAARRAWLGDLAESFSEDQQKDINRILRMMILKAAELENEHQPGGARHDKPSEPEIETETG
jgi:DNA-binding MarR family transcriptional regulator